VSDRTYLTRENLGWLLAKASQRWNDALAREFREAGYPEVRPSFGSVLVPLYEEDGLHMGVLARRSGLSKQAITTLVRAVEAADLVSRIRDPGDARAFRIALTERGEEFRPVGEEVLAQLDARVESRLSDGELARLVESLGKVVEL
jgi:DNA-binding MarR family transcriptional regulator